MSTKGNQELVRQVIKDRNEFAGDAAKVRSWCEKYCAPGYIHHNLARGDLNREQMMQYFVTLMSTFPDFNKSIDDMVAEGDKVVVRYTIQRHS
jgi:predicted SnoaL-like aldol condensation-catalyzing enzyme